VSGGDDGVYVTYRLPSRRNRNTSLTFLQVHYHDGEDTRKGTHACWQFVIFNAIPGGTEPETASLPGIPREALSKEEKCSISSKQLAYPAGMDASPPAARFTEYFRTPP
jgi:hypothetical protein